MKVIDYSKTIMYRIVCKDLSITDCYVGHTTNFRVRKNDHKYSCNIPTRSNYNLKVYEMIRDNGGWENWNMIEIEKYSCLDKNEACKRERYWYEYYNAKLNIQNPCCFMETQKPTQLNYNKAYYKQNQEKAISYSRNYNKNNKEIIKVKNQQKTTCQCGSFIRSKEYKRHCKSQKHIGYMDSIKI
jgi:hypothetical protein